MYIAFDQAWLILQRGDAGGGANRGDQYLSFGQFGLLQHLSDGGGDIQDVIGALGLEFNGFGDDFQIVKFFQLKSLAAAR